MFLQRRSRSGLFVYDYPATTKGSSDPPLVVLVHGSMDRGTSFSRLRHALEDLHVVTYDRHGYHRSRNGDEGGGRDFEGHVQDLLEILDDSPAVLVGHSFGGDIVLAASERRPDLVKAVVAFEPPLTWRDWWPSAGSWIDAGEPGDAAEAFIRRMIGDSRFERLPTRTRAERRSEGPALLAELLSLRRLGAAGMEPPFHPEAISVPVIIGRGSRTNPHQMRGTTEIASEIPGAELVEIPGAGHGAHLTHPAALAAMVKSAIARAERAERA